MNTLRTEYQFTLPRGYVDAHGSLHRTGTMRLATARDELEPLRDPTVQGPDDPRLTILVLSRVITSLGTVELINSGTVEDLFAVDLAFLQDFYGVINFGDQAEFDALVAASESNALLGVDNGQRAAGLSEQSPAGDDVVGSSSDDSSDAEDDAMRASRPSLRHSVEELPRRSN